MCKVALGVPCCFSHHFLFLSQIPNDRNGSEQCLAAAEDSEPNIKHSFVRA
jgi:hypothetical protein